MENSIAGKLINRILEEIHNTLSPDKPVFLRNWGEVQRYFGSEPQGHETEMGEMANIKKIPEKLPQPLKLHISEVTSVGGLPKVVSLDPATNQLLEDYIIGDDVITMPNGVKVLKFYNYGEGQKIDRTNKVAAYVVLPENIFYKHPPRNIKMGTSYVPPDLSPKEGESDKEKEARERRIWAIKEGNAKRYGIFASINQMFANREVLNRLDVCLIPETWATNKRTEHTTNKVHMKKFGGTTPDIDCDFYAVRDLNNIEGIVDEMLDLRAQLALQDAEEEERNRATSAAVPRRHANYIYTKGGNWSAKQRVHDENLFKAYGAKTMIYQLNSKNIQEGNKEVTVESVLQVTGSIQGHNYVLKAVFLPTVYARNRKVGQGEKIGDITDPIIVSLSKPLPADINPEHFTLESNTDFFIDEGRTVRKEKTGFLPSLFDRLGKAILELVDPDDAQQKLVQIVQAAIEAEENTPEPQPEF